MRINAIEAALRDAASPDPEVRRGRFAAFMDALSGLLDHPEVDRGELVRKTVPLLAAVTYERLMWMSDLACRIDEGGEDDALRALQLRSELEVARELYRGTDAADDFVGEIDEDSDNALRARAKRFGYTAPDHVPSTHTWWMPR